MVNLIGLVNNGTINSCGNIIGFGGTMYTLWEYYPGQIRDNYNHHSDGGIHMVDIIQCHYIKNISSDIEVVKKLYPDCIIDMELKGTYYQWESKPFVEFPEDEFHYGRYKGEKIEDCTDESYLGWFLCDCYDDTFNCDRSKLIKKILEEKYGWHFVEDTYTSYDGSLRHIYRRYNKEEWENELVRRTIVDNFAKSLSNGEPISLVPYKNLSCCEDENYETWGEYIFNPNENDSIFKVVLRFKEYTKNYYNGYEYGLPSIKGKGKRFKNKNVNITSYDFTTKDRDTFIVNVKTFEITK